MIIWVKKGEWLGLILAIGVLLAGLVAGRTPAQAQSGGYALPGEDVPIMASIRHLPYLGAAHEPYNSVPPTSGPHLPWTIALGIYHEELPEELQVHALEHGHILIQYAPTTAKDQVQLLEGIARRYSRDVIVAPYSKLAHGIAITAWGRVEHMEQAQGPVLESFIRAFAGRYDHGPKSPGN